jgi:predicted transcriptional regulator
MNIKNTEQIGAVVRERRKYLKVTQKELAMTCDVDFVLSLISKKEKLHVMSVKFFKSFKRWDCKSG